MDFDKQIEWTEQEIANILNNSFLTPKMAMLVLKNLYSELELLYLKNKNNNYEEKREEYIPFETEIENDIEKKEIKNET